MQNLPNLTKTYPIFTENPAPNLIKKTQNPPMFTKKPPYVTKKSPLLGYPAKSPTKILTKKLILFTKKSNFTTINPGFSPQKFGTKSFSKPPTSHPKCPKPNRKSFCTIQKFEQPCHPYVIAQQTQSIQKWEEDPERSKRLTTS